MQDFIYVRSIYLGNKRHRIGNKVWEGMIKYWAANSCVYNLTAITLGHGL